MRKILAQILITCYALVKGYNKEQILFLLAQANHETGNFTSRYWYSDRNLFGMSEMMNPRRRRRLRGVRLGPDGLMRAQFRTLFGSIADRLDWDKQNRIPKKNYGKEVSKIFHTSNRYLNAVNSRIDDSLSYYYYFALCLIPITIILIIKICPKF